jgi:hypothetical protein
MCQIFFSKRNDLPENNEAVQEGEVWKAVSFLMTVRPALSMMTFSQPKKFYPKVLI